MPLFQYQVKAEPVFSGPETTTPDKWLGTQPVRFARPDFRAALATTALAFVALVPGINLEWSQPAQMPVRSAVRTIAEGSSFVFTPTGEVVTVDKWNSPAVIPTRLVPRVLGTGAFTPFQFGETITVDKWFQPTAVPVQRGVVRLADSGAFVFVVTTPEVVTVDKWYQQPANPSRVPARVLGTGAFVQLVAENITVDKWLGTEPARFIRPRGPITSQADPIRVVPTVDGWAPQAQIPVRLPKGILGTGAEIPFIAPGVDSWQPSIPVLVRRSAYVAHYPTLSFYPFPLPNAVLVSEWFVNAEKKLWDYKRQQYTFPSLTWAPQNIAPRAVIRPTGSARSAGPIASVRGVTATGGVS